MKKLVVFFILLFSILLNLYAGNFIENKEKGYLVSSPIQKTDPIGKKYPILITLHGWGMSAKQDIHFWAWHAEKKEFFLIAIDINYDEIKTDIDIYDLYNKIIGIINDFYYQKYPIDINRVYIAGTSAGGMMAINLALIYPYRFKGVGAVSGGVLGFFSKYFLENAKGIHFYFAHGSNDETVPIEKFKECVKELENNKGYVKTYIKKNGKHTLNDNVYGKIIEWLAEQ
jgi:predicted esterase